MDLQAQAAKPENALRRADELIAQDQALRALYTLCDVVGNKRFRTWQGSLEDVMFKLLDLAVDLRKGKQARDGLMQYRSVCQQVNVHSLEKVINHFLEKAETKAKEAQTSSEEAAQMLEGQDLDDEGRSWADDSPESLMMKAVSGESVKDRADREILMPWIRFLWESYRTALDVCRNNRALEVIFHDTAKKAFAFCKQYNRKSEFRRLADLIRYQAAQQTKSLNPETRAQLLGSVESFNRYIETRFKQLHVATTLDLWQEAYKSIEDIHGVITFFKRAPGAKLMLEYFDKLAKVFWVSRNYLFHAHANSKHFKSLIQTKPDTKVEDSKDLQLAASKVVLSALCIPFWEKENTGRQQQELFVPNLTREKNMRITTLLGSTVIPTRASLIQDVVNRGTIQQAFPELRPLYDILEVDFNPLELCAKAQPILAFIKEHSKLSAFEEPLQKVAAVRMLGQLCQVYQTMKITDLVKLVPFYTFADLEPLLVSLAHAKYDNLAITISHHTQSISFNDEEVNCDSLSAQLSMLNCQVSPVVDLCKSAMAPRKKTSGRGVEFFQKLKAALEVEREGILKRKVEIEERECQREKRHTEMELQREAAAKEKQALMETQEMERLKKEAEDREKRRKEEEAEQAALETQKRLVTAVWGGKKTKEKLKVASTGGEEGALDQEKLLELSRQELLRIRQQKEQKLKDEFKRVDFLERACREEERPLLVKKWKSTQDKIKSEATTKLAQDQQERKARWESALKEKTRLSRMEPWWNNFKKEVLADREKMWQADAEARAEQEAALEAQQAAADAEERAAAQAARRQAEENARRREEEERKAAEAEAQALAAEKAAAAKPKAGGGGGGKYVPPSKRK
eukprot:TRINITY_DN62731_c0_g1_i1.p1 TRINITY_DN62731_c0_g1~~TRINITY_DN62731_c0_g1_i1.p1  ORF type:complete len:858 (+),score=191.29 TRINITY_DN62731_c0_g1_i1:84-2657(+)